MTYRVDWLQFIAAAGVPVSVTSTTPWEDRS